MSDNELGKLLGQYINAVFVNADQSKLYMARKWGKGLMIGTYGDCCSETWFADIIGLENLIGHQIIGIELRELPEPKDGRTRQESDSAYGFALKTLKGTCEIVYRNSSNGYYGGSVDSVEEHDMPIDGFTQITEDWSA